MAHASFCSSLSIQNSSYVLDWRARVVPWAIWNLIEEAIAHVQKLLWTERKPVNVNPDPRFLYLTRQIEETLTGLMYGIQTRKGFVTLTGEVDTGKTTLTIDSWIGYIIGAPVWHSRMNSNQLSDFILAEFEISYDSKSKSQSQSLAA